MHRAPVVGIVVMDGHGSPLPEPLEVAHDLARSPDMQGSHHLLVISEEQFKVRNTSGLPLLHSQHLAWTHSQHACTRKAAVPQFMHDPGEEPQEPLL